jgi:hypothetical protein
LPGFTRQSIVFAKFFAKRMDPRVKPGVTTVCDRRFDPI